MQDGVTKTLVMVSLKKHSDPLLCSRLTLVRAYSCKKSCSNNNVMVGTRSQRNCVNRDGTVSEGPVHGRKNVRSGHSQTIIKIPDQERLQERDQVKLLNLLAEGILTYAACRRSVGEVLVQEPLLAKTLSTNYSGLVTKKEMVLVLCLLRNGYKK